MNQFSIFASLLMLVIIASSSVTAETNTSTTVPPQTNTTATPESNTTTTPATTSSSPKPTTTPQPITTTPNPDPRNNYTVKNGNLTCIKMMARIEFDIIYEKKTKSGNANTTENVNLPSNAKSSGSCEGNGTQDLVIEFNDDWSLMYTFEKDGKGYYISAVSLKYSYDSFPNSTKTGSRTVSKKFDKDTLKANEDGYYVCNSKNTMELDEVTVNTRDLKYKAFNEKGDIDFKTGTVSECSADEETNSIVPIAVGAALAGLVVIVLIAYLIGRKRTRKTGYESV